jgi:hypothetical protein
MIKFFFIIITGRPYLMEQTFNVKISIFFDEILGIP